jgi:lysophospholipase L1-like esterase
MLSLNFVQAIMLLVLFFIMSSAMSDLNYFSPLDQRVSVMGRHVVESDGSILFGASGVSFYFRFEGPVLQIDLHDEFRYGTSYNIFTVIINGTESHRFKTVPGQTRYKIASDLPSETHDLILIKDTEGSNGWNRLSAVYAHELLQYPKLPNRRIEFIGDSITCGMGSDEREVACGEGEWMDQHNTWESFGAIIARNVDAQFMLTAVSGMGMHRNWSTPSPIMPDRYQSVFSDPADAKSRWDFSRYEADLVVIALGTNDFSDGDKPDPRPAPIAEEFKKEYHRLLTTVRNKYPSAHILLLNSPVIEQHRNEVLNRWLHEIKQERVTNEDLKIHVFEFTKQYPSGCTGHPSLEEHRLMADILTPVVVGLLQSN